MELNDRKKLILKAIIANYLETGEPVGSRTISKHPELNLSSATIRNEMADLEDMGLILQPHTSAGRIPSDAGYRFYVDQLMMDRNCDLFQDLLQDILSDPSLFPHRLDQFQINISKRQSLQERIKQYIQLQDIFIR